MFHPSKFKFYIGEMAKATVYDIEPLPKSNWMGKP